MRGGVRASDDKSVSNSTAASKHARTELRRCVCTGKPTARPSFLSSATSTLLCLRCDTPGLGEAFLQRSSREAARAGLRDCRPVSWQRETAVRSCCGKASFLSPLLVLHNSLSVCTEQLAVGLQGDAAERGGVEAVDAVDDELDCNPAISPKGSGQSASWATTCSKEPMVCALAQLPMCGKRSALDLLLAPNCIPASRACVIVVVSSASNHSAASAFVLNRASDETLAPS